MKIHHYFVLIVFLYSSCVTKKEILEPILDSDLVTFSKNEIPSELNTAIKKHKIIILGETHYVQEHHDFISVLLNELTQDNEHIFFIQEQPNAFNWMLNDYFNGQIDYLPNDIKYFDHFLFEEIKEINSKEIDSLKVEFFYMDVNHGKSFLSSITESEKIIGSQIEFAPIKSAVFDSNDYSYKLRELNNILQSKKKELIKKWGEKWYLRYLQMVETEVISNIYRTKNDETVREKVMFNLIKSIYKENPNNKIIINCGMNHAQKNSLMGSNHKRIGGLVNQEFPNEVYSIAFVGVKGYSKKGHWYNKVVKYNLKNEAKKNDLIGIIGGKSGNSRTFINLSDLVFKEKILISYHLGKTRKVKPSSQFDAIITYPEIGILKSMEEYEFNGY